MAKQFCVGYRNAQGVLTPATLFGFDHTPAKIQLRVDSLNMDRPDREWFVLTRDVPDWEIHEIQESEASVDNTID